ncbi:hypothetical protein FPV67DRAFT_1679971 [Lyophyllum atratum]|nr:hypothetical protein FPV67DRAFT_1679971 [Lyophyllum atratum]
MVRRGVADDVEGTKVAVAGVCVLFGVALPTGVDPSFILPPTPSAPSAPNLSPEDTPPLPPYRRLLLVLLVLSSRNLTRLSELSSRYFCVLLSPSTLLTSANDSLSASTTSLSRGAPSALSQCSPAAQTSPYTAAPSPSPLPLRLPTRALPNTPVVSPSSSSSSLRRCPGGKKIRTRILFPPRPPSWIQELAADPPAPCYDNVPEEALPPQAPPHSSQSSYHSPHSPNSVSPLPFALPALVSPPLLACPSLLHRSILLPTALGLPVSPTPLDAPPQRRCLPRSLDTWCLFIYHGR